MKRDPFESAIDEILASADGDVRRALRAVLVRRAGIRTPKPVCGVRARQVHRHQELPALASDNHPRFDAAHSRSDIAAPTSDAGTIGCACCCVQAAWPA